MQVAPIFGKQVEWDKKIIFLDGAVSEWAVS